MKIYNQLKLKPLQRQLRKSSTDAERKIWNLVRNRQILGLKFFRQSGVGSYILDFYCPRIKLAIEIDGGQHNESKNIHEDATRTEYLNSLGIMTLRFWNNDVLQNQEGVYDKIINSIKELLPASSLEKEEGQKELLERTPPTPSLIPSTSLRAGKEGEHPLFFKERVG